MGIERRCPCALGSVCESSFSNVLGVPWTSGTAVDWFSCVSSLCLQLPVSVSVYKCSGNQFECILIFPLPVRLSALLMTEIPVLWGIVRCCPCALKSVCESGVSDGLGVPGTSTTDVALFSCGSSLEAIGTQVGSTACTAT